MVTYLDTDKWREASRRAGERAEAAPAVVRFSRLLLVSAALFMFIVSVSGAL